MPRIPRIEPAAAPAPQLRAPVPTEDFGGGDALGRAVSQVADVGAKVKLAVDRSRTERSLIELEAALRDQEAAFETDTDFDTQVERFQAARQRDLAEHRKRLEGNAFLSEFDARAQEVGERGKLRVSHRVTAGRLGEINANRKYSLDTLQKEYERAEDDRERARIRTAGLELIESSRATGAIRSEQAADESLRWAAGLEQADLVHRAQAEEDRIFATIARPADRLAAARNLQGRLRDEVLRRVEHRNAVEATQAAQARAQRAEFERDRFSELVRQMYDENPVSVLESLPDDLDASERIQLHALAQQIAEHAIVQLDPVYYQSLIDERESDFQAFRERKMDPTKLPDAVFRSLVQDQKKIPAPVGSTFETKMELRLIELGYDSKDAAHAADITQIRLFAEQEMLRMQEATGKTLTPVEIQQAIDIATLGARQEWGRDPKAVALLGLPPGEYPMIQGVPEAHVPAVVDQLVRRGERVTEENIQRFYLQARSEGFLP